MEGIMNDEYNRYIVGVLIKGKTIQVEASFIVEAPNKDEAIAEAKRITEEEGFIYDGWMYCDLAD